MDSTTITNNGTTDNSVKVCVPKSHYGNVYIICPNNCRLVAYNITDGSFVTNEYVHEPFISPSLSDTTYIHQCEFDKLMKMYSILSSLVSQANMMIPTEHRMRILSHNNMYIYNLSLDRDGYLKYNVDILYQLAKVHKLYLNETTTRKAEELIARFSKMFTEFINSHCGTSINPIDPTTKKNDEPYEWLC